MKFLEYLEKIFTLDIKKANDLYEPALSLYPQLNDYAKDNWYFSGSGSSFFRINNGK